MANRLISLMFSQIALDDLYEQTWEKWRRGCNQRGEEIYYDLSNPTTHGVVGECGEDTTIELGKYQVRSCSKHFQGHECNPPRYGSIVGFGA